MNDNWTSDELILTLYIYLTHDSKELQEGSQFLRVFCDRLNMYTGNNRTPSAIVMRISNYKSVDPKYERTGLANYGKNVVECWNEFHDKIDYMEDLYNKFVSSTMKELDDDSKTELEDIEKKYHSEDVTDKDEYIEFMINARNGAIQRVFKENLIIEFNQKCALCDISEKRLLIGSHILPYSKCDNKEDMINHYNGLLLCPNHDALFDKKLISFDDDGKIVISDLLSKDMFSDLNIHHGMMLDKKYLTSERIKFLKIHKNMLK